MLKAADTHTHILSLSVCACVCVCCVSLVNLHGCAFRAYLCVCNFQVGHSRRSKLLSVHVSLFHAGHWLTRNGEHNVVFYTQRRKEKSRYV